MTTSHHDGAAAPRTWPLVIGAVGVVFGDIGTSPLYTLKEAFGPHYGLDARPENVLGVLSLILWSLVLVVTLKYVAVLMRADNRGEGGILALTALVQRSLPMAAPLSYTVGILGIFGTALFFGDGVITPAISVLSAVEGLEVAAPELKRFVLPITLAVLVALFTVQKHGTEKVGRIFGPITCLWFLALAVLGVVEIAQHPAVLEAVNPVWAIRFFVHHGVVAWLALGAVVLAVTGGEALYADMGHFGRLPIRVAWLGLVLPALLLNYFGQGAFILTHPGDVSNPFYELVPGWALYPMIVLATLATVIASQALITGTFSVVRQAIQLGYLPRMQIVHTSDRTEGQIYMPWVNRAMLLSVIAVVLGFGSSSNLAIAYGVSVTGTMIISTMLLVILAKLRWRLPGWQVWPLALLFLSIEAAFFSANVIKFVEGAWFPLALGVVAFALMRTWRRGRALVHAQVNRDSLRIEHFVGNLVAHPPTRVPGTAVFLTPSNQYMPPAMLHNLKHNKVLHERNVLLSVEVLGVPRADEAERVVHTDLGHGFARLTLRFGYLEDPDVPRALKHWAIPGPKFEVMETTYFASRESLSAKPGQGMAMWRDKLFLFMSRNATPATEFFHIPGNRLVELGTQVVI
ncbi:potassium transporter Kup [Arenimonas terrae]|jgi:KUP system potassium uptake protein|uniref:Probable potassium transport system protein Kup n=1 Tax=Arenimonas terrae TaxID=2546226 RepID=A0A5C4RWB9_9GAMM|nr:potassium transporter Kup [Arenimonas terrae]TNJ35460.1 potassium transporter Kup [Arenimonas terrae]